MRGYLQLLWGHALAIGRLFWMSTALLLALAVIAGVLLGGSGFSLPSLTLAVAIAAALFTAVGARGHRVVWLSCALLAALALGLWRDEATLPPTGAAGLAYYSGRDVTIVGTVTGEPEVLDRGETIRVAVESLTLDNGAARRVSGTVLAHLGALTPLSYGDRLSLGGTLAPPPILPGGSGGAYRAYLAAQGIVTVMDYPRLQRLGSGNGAPLLALAIALRSFMERGIQHVLPAPENALLLGILLGTRTRALGALTAPFVATGMIHVVAVDGLKVSIFVGTVYRLSRRALGARSAPLPALAALLLYVLLTGATPAGLRSALMWTLALAATHVGRRSDGATSLALAAALLALVTPRILWDLGFQLSLSGTAAIVLLTPGIERRLARLPAAVREVTAVSLAAQAGAVPLVAAGFAQVSLVAPLANALLLPLLGPIIVLGAPAALAGALVPSLGALPGLLVYPFLALMAVAVQALARLPLAAFPSATWPLAIVGGYYLLLGLSTRGLLRAEGSLPRDRFVDGPRLVWLRPVVALGAAVALLVATVAWQAPRGRYVLAVLPLGASQGLLLTTPGGSTALIDAGDTPSALNAALGSRLPFWRTRLDMMALSGVDRAHVGGLRDLLARYTIGRALDPGAVYPAADYVRWRSALRTGGVAESKLRAGARYALDRDAHLNALLPRGLDPDAPDTPVALRLVFGRLSALLLNRAALAYPGLAPALQAGGVRHDTVLVLSGAAGTADPRDIAALVRLLRPRVVVLPPPADPHDDPTADALVARAARLMGAQVWRTTGQTRLDITTDGSRYDIAVDHP